MLAFWAMVVPGKAAGNSTPQYAPPGAWVKPHFFDQQASAALIEAGADQHLLLLERQVDAARDETFIHSVRQVLTTDGVQKESTLTIDFNPGYESLAWHWARIWRGQDHLDRLDAGNVKVVQAEPGLDDFVLNGQKSAVLVLDDVRIGDIIDCAYTIKGVNPVFDGHFSSEVPVQLEEPAERLLTRVLWPAGRRLYARPHGCSVLPVAVAGKDTVEYDWDFRQVPALPLEDQLPAWYDPQPWVQLSGFKTWAEVNQWASTLFKITSPCSPELAQKIAEWRRLPGQEPQILAALRFVQENVRYFGTEIGASTEKPADPSAVFARRFGDCKDKSLLFVAILRALDIEACPVLVNSTLGRALDDWLPSAGAFDHCIAVVQCDGQTYWLDPTMNYQRGPLAAHYLPAYERGLVISPGTTGLTVIPQATGLPQTTITEYFQLRGKTEPADLKVVTMAEGRDAEALRELFATTKRSLIEKNFTHFYAGSFPGIRMTAPVDVADDELGNQVQTTEYYTIDHAWTQSARDRKYRFNFYPAAIAALLRTPVDTDRRLPLGISFPEHVILRTEVALPEGATAEADQKTVYDPAFFFQKDCRCTGNRLGMKYEYQSSADSVAPEAVVQYLGHLDDCTKSLGCELSWPQNPDGARHLIYQ